MGELGAVVDKGAVLAHKAAVTDQPSLLSPGGETLPWMNHLLHAPREGER